MTTFLPESFLLSKVGAIHESTRSKAIEIIEAAEAAGHRIRFLWGMGTGEHGTGNALDIMIYDAAAGDFVRNYVWANRARLRLRHVIWSQHITSTVVSPGVRRLMEDRGNTTKNHFDHNHILFLDANAYVAPLAPGKHSTSVASVKTSTASHPPFPLPKSWYFGPSSGPKYSVSGRFSYKGALKVWQVRMASRGWVINTDGLYSALTAKVAKQFQIEKHLSVDNFVGAQTWNAAWTAPVS